MPKKPSIPKLCLHRPTGQGYVRLSGRMVYLGRHGSPECQAAYERHLGEWLAGGRHAAPQGKTPSPVGGPTVSELLAAFATFMDEYYPANNRTNERENLKRSMVPVRALYGPTPVHEFGPLQFRAVRDKLVAEGLSRGVINAHMMRVRRIIKWGVGRSMVRPDVLTALQAVEPLRRGRCAARECAPVSPVPVEHIDAIKPHVSATIWAMVEVQRFSGMRPGELCVLRPVDLDMTGTTWVYRPSRHKLQAHDLPREIHLGPRAQRALRPFLAGKATDAIVFSPIDVDRQRREAASVARKTAASCGNRVGSNRRRHPKRKPRAAYDTNSYSQAIRRGCIKAGVPVWGPNRLRHNAATEIRRRFGIEAARCVLGHSDATTTAIYAERDSQAAMEIARKIG